MAKAEVELELKTEAFYKKLQKATEVWEATPEPLKDILIKSVADPKKGLVSTEFWVALVVTVANIVLASGAIADLPEVVRIVNAIIAGLAPIAYMGSRTIVKKDK